MVIGRGKGSERPFLPRVQWRQEPRKGNIMGRNDTLSLGALILIIIVVALIF